MLITLQLPPPRSLSGKTKSFNFFLPERANTKSGNETML